MSDHGTTAHNKAIKDFLAEAEEIVEQLGTELADLSDMAEGGDFNPDILNSIFRGAHSLKGLAGMFGFTEISELSHNLENLLDWLRLGKIPLNQQLMPVLFDSHDLLTSLVRTLSDGENHSKSDEIAACISKINARLAPPEKTVGSSPLESLGLSEQVTGALTEYEEHRLLDNISKGRTIFNVHTSFDLCTFDQELSSVTDILKTCGEVVSTLPSAGGNIETHIDFDILFGSTRQLADLKCMVESDAVSVRQLGASTAAINPTPSELPRISTFVAPPPVPDINTGVTVQQPAVAPAPASDETALSAKSMSRTVRVDIGKLDELMNIVGELVLAHSTIAGVTAKMRNEGYSRMAIELGKAAKGLERKLTDLQKGVMEIRMIPVGQLYEKMSRIVRKISREQGKKVELKFFGADTELDKLIVEDISDPMMHIIRNAIDHGIESRETRIARGKDEKGTIRISSFQKGNHVVIEVEDDGNGIDVEKVKNKALQKGLVSDISSMSEREAIDLLFLPGFSTADKVSEVSGRGVGMDVVKNNIAAISGMVDIETRKGEGSRFIITLPITLAIIKALIISCSGRTYALPITSVLESLLMTDREIMTVERKEVIQLRESTLPLLRLERYFDISRSVERPHEFYVVVVGVAEKRLGIVVDDLLGQQDIVIKPLGEAFKRFRGISGAADLGDQRTILVLDVGGIVNETMRSGN
ncbi:MAG: chemotaxis protein CheA [Geobacteraceae bacterium GWC2_55_20]|nr:MAG: chemotaxis protein CheA [Geobacteraceae bacterium GWC2_55_20]OGU19906.1 MAG: chemotaxis protein CheA [Geobacteraceae bacterium GWF2_54_21]HBA72095.1 chemotaxis protein CheA [Geobacter sp.]